MKEHGIIVITGPTASGKSALALSLARRLGTEIISADSRQVYRGIPIATAQPTPEELMEVRHHLVGHLPLDAYYSAAEFEKDSLEIIARLHAEGKMPVVCGGSMMYVDALCHGIDEMPTVSESTRQQLKEEWEEKGDEWLLEELLHRDPATWMKVDRKNLKRVFHAVEVSREAGLPYSSLLSGRKKSRGFHVYKYALSLEREEMFARINLRAERMVEAGLVEEVKSVAPLRHLNSLNTVGIKEMLMYLDGEMTLPEAMARLQKNTRVYAKKQMTWLKRDTEIQWIEPQGALERIITDIERIET